MPEQTCGPDLDRIARQTPGCLRDRPQWVCWKYIQRDGKETKCPVNAQNGHLADSTDASTWSTFDQAIDGCRRMPELAGVGFVFSADDPYCGIDLDDAVEPGTTQLKAWAKEIVTLVASYTEVSPSGGGAKIFLRGTKPGVRCRRGYHDGEVEMYDRDRFFTVTGALLPGAPPTVESRQDGLNTAYRKVFGEDVPAGPSAREHEGADPVVLDDEQIIKLASNARGGGGKFAELWAGDWNKHFNSHSEADSSVAFSLAFYTKDAGQIDRMFRTSGLMRAKWDERHGQQTYGQMTIAKALSVVSRQYKPRSRRRSAGGQPSRKPRPAPPPPSAPALPRILIDDVQLNDLTGQAQSAITRANDPPGVFVRAGQLTRVVRDENGQPAIEPFDRVRMRCRLSEVANFFTLRKVEGGYEEVGTNPPLSLAENVLALGRWEYPPLAGIARSPILRPDGSICTTPGYDAQTRLFYCPDPDLVLPEIPDQPDVHEVQASVDMLMDLIGDFPFADQPSRANALSILFSILMRPVIAGHIPLIIVDAPVQGSGKTLLVTTLGTIAVGSVAGESIPSKQNDDEWRKKITSILLNASPFVLLDNIPDNTTIDSPALAAALTAYEWSDRLLGKNDSVRLPSRAVWAATGNNLRVAGDIPRRSYSVRLDANAERPWERTGFRIEGLDAYVAGHRGELLAAAFTIIRAWYVAGKPRAPVPPFGSFEDWVGTIGSVLAFAGIGGFLKNLDQTRAVQDEDTHQWTAFFDAWWEAFGNVAVTVDDLCNRVLTHSAIEAVTIPDVLLLQRDKGEGSLRRSLGRQLARLTGRVFNDRKLCDAGQDAHRKVRAWRFQPQNKASVDVVSPLTPRNPAANPADGGEQ
jgi:hypothetical protein